MSDTFVCPKCGMTAQHKGKCQMCCAKLIEYDKYLEMLERKEEKNNANDKS